MATAVENFHNLSVFDRYNSYGESRNDTNLMYNEANRLKSFDNWPLNFIDPKSLANAGFYYTNKNDLVRCAFCKIEIMKWQQGDNPMTEHRRWSDKCPFVRGAYCGNISIDTEYMSVSSENMDRKTYGVEIRPNSFPEWKTISNASGSSKLNFHKLDQSKQGPRYSEYNSLESRLKSFAEWPMSIKQKPNQLAAAGFYYNGKGDQTICFHCGLGLKDWADDDDPWEQHVKWSSKCSFLQSQKGFECCSEVSNKQKPVLTPEEVTELRIPNNKNIHNSKTASSSSRSPIKTTPNIAQKSKDVNAKEIIVTLCKICNIKERSILFLPCRHIVVCEDCAPLLTACIICNKSLEATVNVAVSIS